MFISKRWLAKFVNIPSIKDEEITKALNSLGFEVDAYKKYSGLNDQLTIAQVGSVNKIEGAHVNFCFVDTGQDLPITIVCGGANIADGQFVLLAEPGTKIANGLTIATRKILDKSSEGMICALTEIGLEANKLNDNEKDDIYTIYTKEDIYKLLGSKNALDIIGFNDSIWEVDLTLNRSDALGALQLAKELANYFKTSLKEWKFTDQHSRHHLPEKKVTISIDKNIEKSVNSLATAIVLKKQLITIDDSWTHHIFSNDDIWLRNSGAKPSGNFFTDFANIIAIETGQNVLLIDPEKVKSSLKIINKPDNDKEIGLKLMDGTNIVATFGVSMNNDYSPTLTSKEIMLIFPSFDPILMRKQLKAYNTSTIAMQRYIKPLSSRLYDLAYDRFLVLADHYELLSMPSELTIVKKSSEETSVVEIEQAFIDNLLGVKLDSKTIKALFSELDFVVSEKNGLYKFVVDQNRTDISLKADIVEEIARLYGYDNIEPQPLILSSVKKTANINNIIKNEIEQLMLGQRFANTKTYSLLSKETVTKWDLFKYGNPINMAMPLSSIRETYRLSLIPSLMETVVMNASKGNKVAKLYEFSDIYNLKNIRERHLGFAISGDVIDEKAHNVLIKNEWAYVKGVCEALISRYNVQMSKIIFKNISPIFSEIHPYINAEILYEKECLGFVVKLNPAYEQKHKISNTFVADLNISILEKLANKQIRWNEITKFQSITRDVSIILGAKDQYQQIVDQITKNIKFLENVSLVDIYEDEDLQKSKSKSYTINFVFNNINAQLRDEDVTEEFNKIIANIKKKAIVIR